MPSNPKTVDLFPKPDKQLGGWVRRKPKSKSGSSSKSYTEDQSRHSYTSPVKRRSKPSSKARIDDDDLSFSSEDEYTKAGMKFRVEDASAMRTPKTGVSDRKRGAWTRRSRVSPVGSEEDSAGRSISTGSQRTRSTEAKTKDSSSADKQEEKGEPEAGGDSKGKETP